MYGFHWRMQESGFVHDLYGPSSAKITVGDPAERRTASFVHQVRLGRAVATHDRVWERGPDPRRAFGAQPIWQPRGTYWLLGIMVGVLVLEYIVAGMGNVSVRLPGGVQMDLFFALFTITPLWYLHPWTVVTSTLSHSITDLFHILFNGLILFFFGPILERLVGTRRFVTLFLLAGAVSGILQVTIDPGPALGASGAIMMVFGTLVVLMPKEKLLIYGIIPMPFWLAGVLYVLYDLAGALFLNDGIGHFAHLSGMALGLWLGWDLLQRSRRRTTVHSHWTTVAGRR